jgi:hypothetical protein
MEPAKKKAERKLELAACEVKFAEAYAKNAKAIGVCYDLFRQLLADKSQFQWDCITREVHEKYPGGDWMVLITRDFA